MEGLLKSTSVECDWSVTEDAVVIKRQYSSVNERYKQPKAVSIINKLLFEKSDSKSSGE